MANAAQRIHIIEIREGLKDWAPDDASPVFTNPDEAHALRAEWNLKFEGKEHRVAGYVREDA